MIFVTLGTQDKPFDRLLQAVEREIKKGTIKEKVIVQAGLTKYKSDVMEIVELLDSKDFERYVNECSLLITHGGVGSIFTGLSRGKKVIAAARLSKYNEHGNDHQLQIIKKFVSEGYILELKDFNRLDDVLKKVKKFVPKKFKSSKSNVINILENYIDNIK